MTFPKPNSFTNVKACQWYFLTYVTFSLRTQSAFSCFLSWGIEKMWMSPWLVRQARSFSAYLSSTNKHLKYVNPTFIITPLNIARNHFFRLFVPALKDQICIRYSPLLLRKLMNPILRTLEPSCAVSLYLWWAFRLGRVNICKRIQQVLNRDIFQIWTSQRTATSSKCWYQQR